MLLPKLLASETGTYSVRLLVCWPAYRKSNPGWAQIGWNSMPRKPNSSGLALDGSSPRSRKKPWWSVGNQSRRWWRYGISVSTSTGSWQWRLTWAILYVAACINSANFAASSDRWPSTAGAHLPQHLLLVVSTTATVYLYGVAKGEVQRLQMVLNAAARLVVGIQPRHPYPPWCPPLAPCTAPNQLQNRHTGSGLYSRHRPDLFRWRLCSGDCSPWTNQPAFSDAWRSCDPSNTNKIGRMEFPYIRTDGVELAPWFAQAFCYKLANIFGKNWKHTCLGKPTHQPLRTIEEWTYLLTLFSW